MQRQEQGSAKYGVRDPSVGPLIVSLILAVTVFSDLSEEFRGMP